MNTLPEIIGIAGTNGAGKDTLADLRRDHQGARKVSLSDILRVEADKRGLSHERANLSAISTELGARLGAGALSATTIENFYETRLETESGLSIVSVRRPDEARTIQDAGGVMLWIDGDRRMRYERILAAARDRVTDVKTFEQFCAEEDAEMYSDPANPFAVNMSGVREIADIRITNEFPKQSEYAAYLKETFGI